jgi:hypothetical protein
MLRVDSCWLWFDGFAVSKRFSLPGLEKWSADYNCYSKSTISQENIYALQLCLAASLKNRLGERGLVYRTNIHTVSSPPSPSPSFVDRYGMTLQPGCRRCSSVSMVIRQKALSFTHKASLKLKYTRGLCVCETELKDSWAWKRSFPYQVSKFL